MKTSDMCAAGEGMARDGDGHDDSFSAQLPDEVFLPPWAVRIADTGQPGRGKNRELSNEYIIKDQSAFIIINLCLMNCHQSLELHQ